MPPFFFVPTFDGHGQGKKHQLNCNCKSIFSWCLACLWRRAWSCHPIRSSWADQNRLVRLFNKVWKGHRRQWECLGNLSTIVNPIHKVRPAFVLVLRLVFIKRFVYFYPWALRYCGNAFAFPLEISCTYGQLGSQDCVVSPSLAEIGGKTSEGRAYVIAAHVFFPAAARDWYIIFKQMLVLLAQGHANKSPR